MGTLQLVLQILKLDSSRGLSDDIGLGKVLNPVEGGVGEGIETVWRGRGGHRTSVHFGQPWEVT